MDAVGPADNGCAGVEGFWIAEAWATKPGQKTASKTAAKRLTIPPPRTAVSPLLDAAAKRKVQARRHAQTNGTRRANRTTGDSNANTRC
jgi:hypothetical protein